MGGNLTILVNSCDLYEDAWNPFFRLLKIQWLECKYPCILSTECKIYHCDFMNVKTIRTFSGGSIDAWTQRVLKAVNTISTEFVLLCLEDFFFLRPVDDEWFDNIVSSIEQDKSIGFAKILPDGFLKQSYPGKKLSNYFREEPLYNPWRCSAAMGIWRTDFLKEMLFLKCDPWQFEIKASQLSLFSHKKCVYVSPRDEKSVIAYSFRVNKGFGITQRKWLRGNVALMEKYRIDVDFDRLGFLDIDSPTTHESPSTDLTITDRRIQKVKRKTRKYMTKMLTSLRKAFKIEFIKYHLPFLFWLLPRYSNWKKYQRGIYAGTAVDNYR